MSANVLDTVSLPDTPEEHPGAPVASRLPGVRTSLAVLAPAVAAAGVLLVHRLIPSRPDLPMSWLDVVPEWRHPFPLLLYGLLTLAILLAVAQALWRPLRPWMQYYGPLWAGLFVTLGIWDLITVKFGWMPQPYFPGPNEVLGGMIDDAGFLLECAWHSLRLLAVGYLLGVTAGLVTGVLIGWFLGVRYWALPGLKLLGPIPATALVPLVMTIFPTAYSGGIGLIALAVWFPVTMLTFSGIANVRTSYLDVARTLGAGRWYLIARVALPAALPHIFIGMFMGLLSSFLTLMVAETLGVKAGLVYYLTWQQGYGQYAKVGAAVVLMALFFSTILTVLFKLRDRVLKWQKGVIKW